MQKDNTWRKQKNLKRNLYMQVVNELGLRIAGGDLKIGKNLPIEDELCEQFGVSRTVIREATKVLSGMGLICSRPKLGTLVQERKKWNMLDQDVLGWEFQVGNKRQILRDIKDLREVVEPQASKLAAKRATTEDVRKIRGAYQDMADAVADSPRFIEADMCFHTAIINGSNSSIIIQLSETLRKALIVFRETIVLVPGSSQKALPFHEAVLKAIEAGDQNLAYREMQTLISNSWLDVGESLNGQEAL